MNFELFSFFLLSFSESFLLLFSLLELIAIVFIVVNQAAQEHGMGPRGSALICGYTNYHRLLESSLADLKKKEVTAGLQELLKPFEFVYSFYFIS